MNIVGHFNISYAFGWMNVEKLFCCRGLVGTMEFSYTGDSQKPAVENALIGCLLLYVETVFLLCLFLLNNFKSGALLKNLEFLLLLIIVSYFCW